MKNSILPDEVIALAGKFCAEQPHLIATGTEADVYSLDDARVLKVYRAEGALKHVQALQDFYNRASVENVGFAIPSINECGSYEEMVYSVDQRLVGVPLSDIPHAFEDSQLTEQYIDTVLAIQKITVFPPYARRKLLDPSGRPEDWNSFIREEAIKKHRKLSNELPAKVVEILGPITVLADFFDSPYKGEDRLVHGDYHPGNVLILDGRVSAVVDFGTFTLFGDPLYDAATACGFFSMYETDQIRTRKAALDLLFDKIGDANESKVSAYLLVAALTTCDLYPDKSLPIYETGHFQWAQSVLADKQTWEAVARPRQDKLVPKFG
jgi:hypothetical protein